VGSGSSGGSVTMTQERAPVGRGRPIVPPPTGPATSIGRLANALQNIQPDTRPPVQQQIRESQYLRNVEAELGQARSDLSRVPRSTRKPKASMLSKVGDSIKSAYRRLSGGGESDKGTYALLPTQEPKTKTKTLGVSADAPKSWPAMEKAKVRNEKIIRESIEKTNQKEIEKALKLGISVPEELVAQARINFAKQFKDNSKKSANTLQRVFRGHIARSDYHELDKRRVNATSNLAQLSKTALKQSNLDAINPQQMVLRSGAETGTTPRLAAFRETHPQTVALQNKISDLKRGKGTGDLKQLQEQLQAAKKDEGVGQAKRGRPAGSKNVKK
jgi:hypothetical protein